MALKDIPAYALKAVLAGLELFEISDAGTTKRTTAQAIADLYKGTKGADITSAATTDLVSTPGHYRHITGTTTITGLGTSGVVGTVRAVIFDGILTLTGGASLILPGPLTNNNILTAAGDIALFVNEGSDVWRCLNYFRKSGKPLYPAGINQRIASADTTTVMADANGHIFHPTADATARVFTIDSNANVAYEIGTTLTFVNEHGAGVVTIAITADTMRLSGSGLTGSRTLAVDGVATALKVTATSWIISGSGLT